jgi:hypothetical protein
MKFPALEFSVGTQRCKSDSAKFSIDLVNLHDYHDTLHSKISSSGKSGKLSFGLIFKLNDKSIDYQMPNHTLHFQLI